MESSIIKHLSEEKTIDRKSFAPGFDIDSTMKKCLYMPSITCGSA